MLRLHKQPGLQFARNMKRIFPDSLSISDMDALSLEDVDVQALSLMEKTVFKGQAMWRPQDLFVTEGCEFMI